MALEMFQVRSWPRLPLHLIVYGSIDGTERGRHRPGDIGSRRWRRSRTAYNRQRRSQMWRGVCTWARHVEASRGRPLRGGLRP